MNLVFCGPPFSGKSTVSRIVADHLGWDLLDTDRLIEEKTGLSCRDLYLEKGEDCFRDIEREVLESLERVDHKVIALGGGVIEIELVKQLGIVIYLELSAEVLWKRMKQDFQKPAYLSKTNPFEEFLKRISSRITFYEKMADYTFSGELPPEEIAKRVIGVNHGIQ